MRHPLPKLVAAALAACLVSMAFAQTKADTTIRYRQGLMNVMGWNFEQLGAVVRHTGTLDTKARSHRCVIDASRRLILP